MATVNLGTTGTTDSSNPYAGIDYNTLMQQIAAMSNASNPSVAILNPQYYGASNAASSLSPSTIQNPPTPTARPTNSAGAGLAAFHNNVGGGGAPSLPTSTPAAQPQSVNQSLGTAQTSSMNPLQIFLSQILGKHTGTNQHGGILSNLFNGLGGISSGIEKFFTSSGDMSQKSLAQQGLLSGTSSLDNVFNDLSDKQLSDIFDT